MRYPTAKKYIRLTAALVLVLTGAAVTAGGPLSAYADGPVSSTTSTSAAAALSPVDGEVLISHSPKLPAFALRGFADRLKAEDWLRRRIYGYHRRASAWARIMGVSIRPIAPARLDSLDLPALNRALMGWAATARHVQRQAQHPPHLAQFLCIHRYEGPWNDPNPPYFGGLQMDVNFMTAYGNWLYRTKGTADHWSPLEQIWVAERGYRSPDSHYGIRGFHPWPNTAHDCGLL